MRRLSATKCMQRTAFRSSALRPLRSEVESARARPRRSRPSVTRNALAPNGSGAGAIPPNMPSWSRVRHKISVWSRFLFKGFFEYLICALPCLARKIKFYRVLNQIFLDLRASFERLNFTLPSLEFLRRLRLKRRKAQAKPSLKSNFINSSRAKCKQNFTRSSCLFRLNFENFS